MSLFSKIVSKQRNFKKNYEFQKQLYDFEDDEGEEKIIMEAGHISPLFFMNDLFYLDKFPPTNQRDLTDYYFQALDIAGNPSIEQNILAGISGTGGRGKSRNILSGMYVCAKRSAIYGAFDLEDRISDNWFVRFNYDDLYNDIVNFNEGMIFACRDEDPKVSGIGSNIFRSQIYAMIDMSRKFKVNLFTAGIVFHEIELTRFHILMYQVAFRRYEKYTTAIIKTPGKKQKEIGNVRFKIIENPIFWNEYENFKKENWEEAKTKNFIKNAMRNKKIISESIKILISSLKNNKSRLNRLIKLKKREGITLKENKFRNFLYSNLDEGLKETEISSVVYHCGEILGDYLYMRKENLCTDALTEDKIDEYLKRNNLFMKIINNEDSRMTFQVKDILNNKDLEEYYGVRRLMKKNPILNNFNKNSKVEVRSGVLNNASNSIESKKIENEIKVIESESLISFDKEQRGKEIIEEIGDLLNECMKKDKSKTFLINMMKDLEMSNQPGHLILTHNKLSSFYKKNIFLKMKNIKKIYRDIEGQRRKNLSEEEKEINSYPDCEIFFKDGIIILLNLKYRRTRIKPSIYYYPEREMPTEISYALCHNSHKVFVILFSIWYVNPKMYQFDFYIIDYRKLKKGKKIPSVIFRKKF